MMDPDHIAARRALFPALYSNDDEVVDQLERYAVETPLVAAAPSLSSSPEPTVGAGNTGATEEEDDQQQQHAEESTDDNTPTPSSSEPTAIPSTRHSSSSPLTDVWGRLPAKEPPFMIKCSICHRRINTLRFAPHLDKCMGLGVGSRVNTR